jgi:hypothetical protein
MLEQLVAGELESAREQDAELARWSVDDAVYEMAVRVRLPWRLEVSPAERVARSNEVIQIIDLAAPFADSAGLVLFPAHCLAGQRQFFVETSQNTNPKRKRGTRP